MQTKLDYKRDFLCVLSEFEIEDGESDRTLVKEWYPVHATEEVEALTLVGRPVTPTDSEEGIYVDEEGNMFQLLNKGETKPIEIEHLPEREKTELEVPPGASLKAKKTQDQSRHSKKVERKNRTNGRKRQALPTNGATL